MPDWMDGDSVYGNSPELRRALRESGKAFVLDVGEELSIGYKQKQILFVVPLDAYFSNPRYLLIPTAEVL